MDKKLLHSMYEKMYLIRETENLILDGFKEGLFSGTAHVCIGQEAVPVGIISALAGKNIAVFSNHRGHGHMLALGLPPEKLIYEIAGMDEGQCGGLGGSQHIIAPEIGFMGSNGITGGSVPIAVGYALGKRMKGEECISVAFFGDGATSQGAVHEAMNLASIWRLPVLFVCEHNMYAMSSPAEKFVSGDLIVRAAGYSITSASVWGMDVEGVYEDTTKIIDFLKEGPVFLECRTYRYGGHSKSDRQLYRTKKEVSEWKQHDSMEQLRKRIDTEDFLAIEDKVDNQLDEIRDRVGL